MQSDSSGVRSFVEVVASGKRDGQEEYENHEQKSVYFIRGYVGAKNVVVGPVLKAHRHRVPELSPVQFTWKGENQNFVNQWILGDSD